MDIATIPLYAPKLRTEGRNGEGTLRLAIALLYFRIVIPVIISQRLALRYRYSSRNNISSVRDENDSRITLKLREPEFIL